MPAEPAKSSSSSKEGSLISTYVLVAGAWLGGWVWQPITRQLREYGHDVHPVTLTGLGERPHLATPQVDLDPYLADVVNLVEFEDLHDVVLVGHSYAGHVVTGQGSGPSVTVSGS
jgi:pimeloyl-ACP methyl ester carboxylesterase